MNRLLKSFFGLFLGAAFSLGVAESINANKSKVSKPTEAATVSETSFRVYVTINVNYIINPTIRTSWSLDSWASMGTSISASSIYPASSSLGTYVYDVPMSSGTQTWLGLHCYDNDDGGKTVYIPKNSAQSQDDTTNSLYGVTFAPGHIYKVTVKGWSGESSSGYWHKCFDWEISDYGVFVHYDYNGGTGGAGTSKNYEKQASSTFKTEVAPSKTGNTFTNWTKSTGGTVNANTNITIGTSPITLTANWTLNTYTVNFDVQGHGTAPSNQTISHGGKVTKPSNPIASGYYFCGWFKEAECENEWNFTSDTVTSATTIFAKWAYTNPTVYFVNGYSWEQPHIHYWGGDTSTVFPGNEMDPTYANIHCLVGTSWYNIGIWKYTISGSPTNVQFNKGNNSEQTLDLVISDGGIYWYGVDAGKFGGVASYLVSLVNSMGSYSYNGNTYPKSICTINSSSALVSQYNTLATSTDPDVVESIQESTIYTYSVPVSSPSAMSEINIPTLISQIKKNNSNGGNGALRIFGLLNLSENNAALVTVVVVSLGILSIGAYFFFKKSKKAEE